jgi:hypothetical protein
MDERLTTPSEQYGDFPDWTLGIQGHTISSGTAISRSGERLTSNPSKLGRADWLSYIVDFEVCDNYSTNPEHDLEFSDDDLIVWGLAEEDIYAGTLIL